MNLSFWIQRIQKSVFPFVEANRNWIIFEFKIIFDAFGCWFFGYLWFLLLAYVCVCFIVIAGIFWRNVIMCMCLCWNNETKMKFGRKWIAKKTEEQNQTELYVRKMKFSFFLFIETQFWWIPKKKKKNWKWKQQQEEMKANAKRKNKSWDLSARVRGNESEEKERKVHKFSLNTATNLAVSLLTLHTLCSCVCVRALCVSRLFCVSMRI